MNGTTAWFGNQSGAALGFSWSDSANLGPVYFSQNNSLAYHVGSSFSIDPATVGSGWGEAASVTNNEQRKVFYTEGLWWVFWANPTDGYIAYSTSSNTSTWASPTTVSSSGGYGPSFWVWGSTIYYVTPCDVSSCYSFYWRYGTLNSNGTITWAISETSVGTSYIADGDADSSGPVIAYDGTNLWVTLAETSTSGGGHYYYEVFKYSSGTWTKVIPAVLDAYSLFFAGAIVPVTSGVVFAYLDPSNGTISFEYSSNGGSTWTCCTLASDYIISSSQEISVTALGNNVYVAYRGSNDYIDFLSYTYGGAVTSPTVINDVLTSPLADFAISTDSHSVSRRYVRQLLSSWILHKHECGRQLDLQLDCEQPRNLPIFRFDDDYDPIQLYYRYWSDVDDRRFFSVQHHF